MSGQRPAHAELETKLAHIYECDGALAFVSGHYERVLISLEGLYSQGCGVREHFGLAGET